MKLPQNISGPCFALAFVFSLMFALPGTPGSNKPEDKPGVRDTKPEDSQATLSLLAKSSKDFKLNPNDVTWSQVSQAFKSLLAGGTGLTDADTLIKANPPLAELGVKVFNAGSAKVWLFPRISESHELYIHWVETKAQTAAGRRRTTHTITSSHIQGITIASSVVINGAKVISMSVGAHQTEPPKLKSPNKRLAGKGGNQSKKVSISHQRYLIVTGSDRLSSAVWLKSYKLGFGGWQEDPYPLSGIPPFLLTNLSGQVSLSGSDLLLTINPSGEKAPQKVDTNAHGGQLTGPSAYQLVLRLVNGRYALNGRDIEDAPINAVREFVSAVLGNRVDLAKGWLIDPKLISIPKYIGLASGHEPSALRILSMPCAAPAIYRYRLITYLRNDLIFDVTKSKSWWAIKGIFIAPADPALQKLAKSLPSSELSLTNLPTSVQERKSAPCPQGTSAQSPTNRLTSDK